MNIKNGMINYWLNMHANIIALNVMISALIIEQKPYSDPRINLKYDVCSNIAPESKIGMHFIIQNQAQL